MELIERIREAGVVGAGGAGFPTDKKLDCRADVFIVNGIECEPLLRTDRHAMEQHAERIVRTAEVIRDHIGAKRAVIALKKHYKEAVEALTGQVKGTEVELYLSESFYPAGDEQNLVFCVTGKVVPTGGIPLDVGCVVSNVSTVLNIADAIEEKPVTDKLVTVAGSVVRPVTISCPIGTPLSKLLEAAGGAVGDCRFIVGGPLMGAVTDDLSQPVTKTTGGLLAFPKDHMILARKTFDPARETIMARAACSQCSFCTQLCPRNAMGLHVEPHKAMRALAAGKDLPAGDVNGIFSCCDCGLCTYYACNFGMKPGKAMQLLKAALQKEGIRPVKEVRFSPEKGIGQKRVPTERLLQRLDLKRYDKDAPYAGSIDCDHVRIPLKMHIGNPDEPVVRVGMKVNKGEPIAKAKGMGAHIHASISGTILEITDESIEIGADGQK